MMSGNAKTLAFVAMLALAAFARAAGPAAATGTTRPAYTLAPGDRIRVTVFDAPNLSGMFSINPRGDVALPLLGDVPVADLTPERLAAAIRARLAAGYVKDPRVGVEIVTYRPYYIFGEVNKPGQFPFSEGLTVQQAVAAAGGYTYRAARHSAFVTPPGGVETSEKLGAAPAYVRPGDTIRIGERYF